MKRDLCCSHSFSESFMSTLAVITHQLYFDVVPCLGASVFYKERHQHLPGTYQAAVTVVSISNVISFTPYNNPV